MGSACLRAEPPRRVVYNDIGGDGSPTLDRAIKEAYAARYAIVDTAASQGYAGPKATAASSRSRPQARRAGRLGDTS